MSGAAVGTLRARAATWRLEERKVPESLAKVVADVPLRCATFPSACSCCQPAPLSRTQRGFVCKVTAAEWIGLGDQDWTVVSVQDGDTGDKVTSVSPDTELRKGSVVVFLVPDRARASGKPWAEEDRVILGQTAVGEKLPQGVRIELDQISGAEFRVIRGATVHSRIQDRFTFEYDPLTRVCRNFGQISDYVGSVDELDLLWFRDEAVEPKRALGRGGLDLKGRMGLETLGIARYKKAATWNNEVVPEVYWCPPPDFEVLPGDIAIVLPNPALYLQGATVFRERARWVPSHEMAKYHPRLANNSDEQAARLPVGASVEYYSTTHGGWTPAIVKDYDEKTGNYTLDIQPIAAPNKVRPVMKDPDMPMVRPTDVNLHVPHGGAMGAVRLPRDASIESESLPGRVGDVHSELDQMAHHLGHQANSETTAGKQELERAQRRLYEAQRVRDAKRRSVDATWFYSPGAKKDLEEADAAVGEAQRAVDRLLLAAEARPRWSDAGRPSDMPVGTLQVPTGAVLPPFPPQEAPSRQMLPENPYAAFVNAPEHHHLPQQPPLTQTLPVSPCQQYPRSSYPGDAYGSPTYAAPDVTRPQLPVQPQHNNYYEDPRLQAYGEARLPTGYVGTPQPGYSRPPAYGEARPPTGYVGAGPPTGYVGAGGGYQPQAQHPPWPTGDPRYAMPPTEPRPSVGYAQAAGPYYGGQPVTQLPLNHSPATQYPPSHIDYAAPLTPETRPNLRHWDVGATPPREARPPTGYVTVPEAAMQMGARAPSKEEHEDMIAQLVNMGFSVSEANEAFRRCSSVQAAAQWLLEGRHQGH